MMPAWKGILRAATEADAEDVLDFYKKNPSDNILDREQMFRDACRDGRQFVVEVEGELVAVSGYYPSGNPLFVEVGGSRVADVWNGFGLQGLLFLARFASILLTEDAQVQITTGVDPEKAAGSLKTIQAHRFATWADPAPELLVECDAGPGRNGCAKKKEGLPKDAKCCCAFFLMPVDTLREHIREFLELTRHSLTIERSREDRPDKPESPGGILRIDVACASMVRAEMREDLEAFCRGD